MSSPLEQKLVARVTGPSGFNVAGLTVNFSVTTEPSRTTGTAIGSDEQATARTYAAVTDANGYARATAILGSNEGSYTFTAATAGSQYNATFSFTAKKPSSIVILKDTADLSKKTPTYTASLIQPTSFVSVALDAAGAKIGPVKTDWSITSTVRRGDLPAGPVATNTFVPSGPGEATIKVTWPVAAKKPALTASAPIFVTQLNFTVGPVDPSNPYRDDLPTFVPGANADGGSISVGAMPQQLTGHLAIPAGEPGTATLKLSGTTMYPGIAMNYPIPATPTMADYDISFDPVTKAQQADIRFAAATSNDGAATLYVNDYAAWAHFECSIVSGTNTYNLSPLTIPVDKNDDKIADVGWQATDYASGASTHVSASSAADDNDSVPVVWGAPSQGRYGDGLTALEEYRGFVADNGAHIRLNPDKKELFVRMDDRLKFYDADLKNLPVSIIYVAADQVQGDIPPVVNPNRGDTSNPFTTVIPGATAQRALRIRERTDFAMLWDYTDPDNPVLYNQTPAIKGQTYLDTDPIDAIVDPPQVKNPLLLTTEASLDTNDAKLIDIFTRSHREEIMHLVGSSPADPNAKICTGSPTDGPCDWIGPDPSGTYSILDPGSDGWQTVPMGGDFFTAQLRTACGAGPIVEASADDMTEFIMNTVAHEAGHGVDMEHSPTCPDMMTAGPTVCPFVTAYSDNDIYQIRLHRKH